MDVITKAERLLADWKGEAYVFGHGVLSQIGRIAREFGDTTLVVTSGNAWLARYLATLWGALEGSGVTHRVVNGARPNAPREDVYRIAMHIVDHNPDSVVALGGGSTIDAVKAASVLAAYSPHDVESVLGVDWVGASTIDPYFGTGMVARMKDATGRDLIPVIAVQTASSSAAHLTKYSNVTDPITGQKKLIVDAAITPKAALFDYGITVGAPRALSVDGGLDGIAHSWEVLMGATGKNDYAKIEEVTISSIQLIVENLETAVIQPRNVEARTALGLGTDLGGYAIMLGGTSGAHLGSFSLVDVLTHGRACGILNPYYTVLFAPRIQAPLNALGAILKEAGYAEKDPTGLEGRDLGIAVAQGLVQFSKALGVPTTLTETGATRDDMDRMLRAAKNPQLKMKLLNMPTPLDPDRGDVDIYMKSVLDAAFSGDFSVIKNVENRD
jgi:alcohol dehydrogenase class IV